MKMYGKYFKEVMWVEGKEIPKKIWEQLQSSCLLSFLFPLQWLIIVKMFLFSFWAFFFWLTTEM